MMRQNIQSYHATHTFKVEQTPHYYQATLLWYTCLEHNFDTLISRGILAHIHRTTTSHTKKCVFTLTPPTTPESILLPILD